MPVDGFANIYGWLASGWRGTERPGSFPVCNEGRREKELRRSHIILTLIE